MARGKNLEKPRPIIVRKVVAETPHQRSAGTWKVAYADFVTAMMAFFLLMWLLAATDDEERKALAEYFTPTLVQMRDHSAGAEGLFGGESIISDENYHNRAMQMGERSLSIPRQSSKENEVGFGITRQQDRAQFAEIKARIEQQLRESDNLKELHTNIRFTETREGLRIELIDEADFSMFDLATDTLRPRARQLLKEVAEAIKPAPNPLMIRGHTDALPFSSGRTMNNWMLSTARAEATRKELQRNQIGSAAFFKIEGVADREPYTPHDIYDPRNRRISITLGWQTEVNPN
ncbi:flagellar motor protein MotB [Parasphingorhabdus cellanae]|uniref:OmpA family protein n=1 Tax=Parasphingorhabdus cellanae TaxID=2806553 RepID=A0ABX7T911_9SPHN|nr:flagellar motor protein MotB [Parasphingorhabdus cellanae]QTD56503.1 OmpA family protein [Parasphingorhabdus cellanae]